MYYNFLGPGLDLKLHPRVRSSRNSMKVLTARTDVSYLRDHQTGGEEGVCGAFLCLQGLFVFQLCKVKPWQGILMLGLMPGLSSK